MKSCKAILITKEGFRKVIEVYSLMPTIDIPKRVSASSMIAKSMFDIPNQAYETMTFYRTHILEGSKHYVGWYVEE